MKKITSEDVVIRLYGWKWMAWIDTPTRSHPNYPQACYVRQLLSPESLKNKRWKEHLAKNFGREAFGNEPLSYRYCSSLGPQRYPCFLGEDDGMILEFVKQKWKNKKRLMAAFKAALPEAFDYRQGDYSRAAMAAMDSVQPAVTV